MKITIVSNFDLASGRGPVFRLVNILPAIAKAVDLTVISLQEPDDLCKRTFALNNIKYEIVHYETEGWSIVDCDRLSSQITDFLYQNKTQLCVLGWELWDLAVLLFNEIDFSYCKFAVVLHSMPFVDALPFPTIYEQDIELRLQKESNSMIADYLAAKAYNAREYITKFNIISINETVTYYLNTYFPGLSFFHAYPGYALDVNEIDSIVQNDKIYDFIFMSKLETSKGIFDLIEISSEIKKINPRFTIRIIGDFLYDKEKTDALKRIKDLQLEDNISFAGWLSDDKKYKELKKAKIFLYPSLTGDTFSFCLLEALACGLCAVTYNTPFARIIYKNAPVEKVEYRNIQRFANVAINMLDLWTEDYSYNANKFVLENYSDWNQVALAEVRVYHELLAENKDRNGINAYE